MNVARIAVLAVALGAGFLAWSMARNLGGEGDQIVIDQAIETDGVLVAVRDVEPGQFVTAEDFAWEEWPRDNINAAFIRRTARPDAPQDFEGAIVRSPIYGGEPIRQSRLVRAGSGGYLSAVLPSGMRAVSTRTSPQTGAGGFILPNDRVDVILTRRDPSGQRGDDYFSERVLSNVRVLAIDQTDEERNGRTAAVGNLATLELLPDQAEVLALAEQLGDLTLSLRSIADVNDVEFTDGPVSHMSNGGRRAGSVSVVKFGVSNRVNAN